MRSDKADSFHILGLRPEPDRPLANAFREVLGSVLSRIEAASPDEPRFRQRLARCHAVVQEADHPEAVASAGALVLATVDEVFGHRRQEAELRDGFVSAIATVREVITSLAGDQKEHSEELRGTADRFDMLQTIVDPQELKACLLSEIATLRRLAERRDAHWQHVIGRFQVKVAALERQLVGRAVEATHDDLTGLPNRRYIAARFSELQQQRRSFVLAMADLDDFKRVNDELGHGRGDTVLKAVAQRLLSSVRTTDVVARVGGDEFVVLLLDLSLPQAEGRFRTLMKPIQVELADDPDGPAVGVSCGLAEYSAGDTLHSLMQRADEALYQAKRQGKNRVVSKAAPYIRDLR